MYIKIYILSIFMRQVGFEKEKSQVHFFVPLGVYLFGLHASGRGGDEALCAAARYRRATCVV
jgi:hypothetical protein